MTESGISIGAHGGAVTALEVCGEAVLNDIKGAGIRVTLIPDLFLGSGNVCEGAEGWVCTSK